MERKFKTVVISTILLMCSLLFFQNCSVLKTLTLTANNSFAESSISEMMKFSEQQVNDTRKKLEQRNDMFQEADSKNLIVGEVKKLKPHGTKGALVDEPIAVLNELEPDQEITVTQSAEKQKRSVSSENQLVNNYDEDVEVEALSKKKKEEN